MFKNKKNGFFLSETIVIIAIVSVVLLGTFKLFSSVYSKYKEGENYNKISAINATSTLKQYYNSKGFNYSTLLNGGYYLELTDLVAYESAYYDKLKEQLSVNKVYLVDLTKVFDGTNINVFDVSLRKYLKTLQNSGSTVVVLAVVNGSEYASISAIPALPSLIGNANDEYAVYVPLNGTFTDPGYTNWDGAPPTTSWEPAFDASKVGKYYLTYNFGGYFFKRKVIVGEYAYNFDYTGALQTFTVPTTGYYQLETWGAQGGEATFGINRNRGGYGGYSKGVVYLTSGSSLYIYVGGAGQGGIASGATLTSSTSTTGYNGGGYIGFYPSNSLHGGGGGATHIATVTGLLSTLSANQSTILIVAGGGGGGGVHNSYLSYSGTGGSGGGYIGASGTPNNTTCYNYGNGGTQSAVGNYTQCATDGHADGNDVVPVAATFGKGANYASYVINLAYAYAGGGGGFYGGWSGNHGAGGGGSGYIANSLLLSRGNITKSMYCYNCTTSAIASTLTYSTTNVSSAPTSSFAKMGHGYAKISYLGE